MTFRHCLVILAALMATSLSAQSKYTSHLSDDEVPDITQFLPGPPSVDDNTFINDWIHYRWGKQQRETARVDTALADGARTCDYLMSRFAPVIGFTINADNAPLTYALMCRLQQDINKATGRAKRVYSRARPYQQFKEQTPCPQWENDEHTSYPSAHTAQGWLYALTFVYFDPDLQEELFKVGYDYGQSRIILGYHYQSDVEAGRMVASTLLARLLAVPGFMQELQAAKAEYTALKEQMMGRPIVILYDNDVHCGIEGYAQLAGLRDAIRATDTAYVATVSAGDFIQGGTAGTLSKGQYIIDILNAVGYDAITIGNHEFDYQTPRLLELTAQLTAPVTCVNFSDITTGQQVYAPYVIKAFGRRKVAFVGVLTPSTLQSEAAAFYDAAGRQCYDLHHDSVYQLVQQAADSARSAGADYVVVLSHLGETGYDIVSGQLIAHTTGIDAVLDGHTHSVIPCSMTANREGQLIPCSQTGTKLANIGKLLISRDGHLSTQLLPTAQVQERSATVAALIDSVKQADAAITARVCAHSDQLLTISDKKGVRQVRRAETNLADLVADAFRWYGGAELSIVNAGGIRADVKAGDVTYGNLMDVTPFESQTCVIKVSGHLLADVLEVGAESVPDENGFFVQCSGFRYTVNTQAVPRVTSVEVLNADGQYEPINPERTYTLALPSYCLTKYKGLMQNCEVVRMNIGLDVEAVHSYLTGPLNGHIGKQYAAPQGRIHIVK